MFNSIDEANNHINFLKNTLNSIDLKKITILTGANGSGKSIIRKLLPGRVSKETQGGKCQSISIENMVNQHIVSFPTSKNTFLALESLRENIYQKLCSTKYIILDEFEIGCSEETVLAFSKYINSYISCTNIGVLIITHSKLAVENLKYDNFINLQGLTKDEWINREFIPTNLDFFSKDILHTALELRLN